MSFGFGIYNISYAANNYYQFDVITNVERILPEKVAFPAITICMKSRYIRTRYRNESLIKTENYFTNRNENILKNFLNLKDLSIYFNSKSYSNVSNHLDFFKSPDYSKDCLRFNGITNKSIELFKTSSLGDFFLVEINSNYIEPFSKNEYFNYSFIQSRFNVYIGDKYLKSFDKLEPLLFESNNYHVIEIVKESTEIKLPEPYNQCKESSVDEPNHQSNCFYSCIFREIKNKYNCTFPLTLFAINGLELCDLKYKLGYSDFEKEFSVGCLKICSLESCFSEKLTSYIQTTIGFSKTIFQLSFRDLSTLNITQIPKIDWFTFLNNIGGGLGLFMSIAFPTLIEFLQFIVEIFSMIIYQ